MKASLLLVTTAVLVGATALAQLRITAFNSSGELTWTNSARVGAYYLEWADSPSGPWKPFVTQTNLNSILAETNRLTVQVPLTNVPALYRVAWIPPDPVGVWDYRAYDSQGTLVVTGVLSLLWATNPPQYYYGWRDFKYVGPTNPAVNVGPQPGAGGVQGYLDFPWAHLGVEMPTNTIDFYVGLSGTIWRNCYTGQWQYVDFQQIHRGPFSAVRVRSTNLTNNP